MPPAIVADQRPAQLLELASADHHHVVRAQNFVVQWLVAGRPTSVASQYELLLLLPECGASVSENDGSAASANDLPARSVVILPAGRYTITLNGAGAAVVIASTREDLGEQDIDNHAAYTPPDDRIAPFLPGFSRTSDAGRIVVIDIDKVVAPAGKSRLKMFQTETLSINWVEYDGPRDPTQLSPHSHTDFEQGSLSMAGNYVHHLRTPWGNDSTRWEEDQHLEAGLASLLVVPVNMIHTTQGVGPGRHLLIDIFSPPRRDFIAKGWVDNAGDYRDESGV